MKLVYKITTVFILGAVSCTALYYGVLFALPHFVDLNKYKNSVISSIAKETGFKVSCEDITFKKTLTPHLKLHLYHTLILYPDNTEFLKLKETDLEIKILPLLLKKIEVSNIKLARPIINITLYKDFSTSIEKYKTDKIPNTRGFKFITSNAEVLCNNYKIKINDESINKLFYLEGKKLLLKEFIPNKQVHIVTKGNLYHKETQYIKYDMDIISFLDKSQFTFSPFKTLYNSDIKAEIYALIKAKDKENITGEIKINNLKLKANNIILKNNSIDLIFKGEELRLNSILHTSKHDIAKLSGEYIFGKNKKLNINTKAKNINLNNLHKIISEITDILNVKNPIKEAEIDGIINADFNIKSDFKTLSSSGHAKISNAKISHKELPCALTNINSEIDFSDNKILISQTKAYINGVPITLSGEINKDVEYNINAKSGNIDYTNLIKIFNINKKLPFDIKRGKLSFEANIKGILNKTYTGDIVINNISALINKHQIKADELKLLFDDKKVTIPQNSILSPVPINIWGEIKDYNKKPAGIINFQGEIPSKMLSDTIKKHINIANKPQGYINTNGVINYNNETIHVKAQLQADKNNYISYAVIRELLNKNSLLNLDCYIKNNNISISDLTLYENPNNNQQKIMPVDKLKKIINITGQIENLKDITLKNIRITIPSSISSASNFLGGEEFNFKADLTLNNKLSTPDIKGNIKINELKLKKYLTAIKNANLNFENKQIKITMPDVAINNSLLNITAEVIQPNDIKNVTVSNIMLHSTNLDINTLFPILKQKIFNKSKINIQKGSVTINNVQILDLKANDLSANISMENNIIKISDIIASAYGGSITGILIYNPINRVIKSSIKGSNTDIKTALYDLCKLDDNISGRSDFNADISLTAGEYAQTIKSLKGQLNFNAKNGKMGTLGKFEYYLYAQNILYHGLLNTTLNRIANLIQHDNTTQYRSAKGKILFDNGYIIANEIQTIGTNMSLYITGKHNMLSNLSDIDIYGRISDNVNSKLGDFANYSISDFMSNPQEKKDNLVIPISNEITDKIPDLYNGTNIKSNTFKVNVYGNMRNINSINSFTWIMPHITSEPEENTIQTESLKEEKLPTFSNLRGDKI